MRMITLIFFPILFFSFVLPAQGSILLDKVVAIVNKEAITWSDLYKAMEFEIAESGRNLSDDERRKFFKENETPFLEILIDMKLQLQEAQRTGIFVSPDEVKRAIKSIKDKYSMTDEIFIQTLKKEGFTLDEYKRKLNEKITVGRLIDQEVKSRILIDEETITKYISQHKELSGQYEGYNLSHIFLKKTANRNADEVRARQIYNKLKAGEAFSNMAAQYSEDATAPAGGELGLINRADLSREFLEAINKIKIGEISEPFWTDKGIHILRLNTIVSTEKSAQLREQVKQKLAEEKFMKVYKNWLKGLRERAYIQILIKPY